MDRALGVCVGAVTLSVAEQEKDRIVFHRLPHEGNVAQAMESFLGSRIGARIGVTGQKYRRTVPYPSVAEPQAVELSYRHIRDGYPGIDTIVSAGGETFLAYSLDPSGRVRSVHTGSKCAAGTGEFFLQQVRRMGLTVQEAVAAAEGREPYRLASRCSVFCKSDCTHALNKGVDRSRIAAGLCRMVSAKITELLKAAGARRVLLVGGVSRNPVVVRYLRESYPETFVPDGADCFEALGALLWIRNGGDGKASAPHLPSPSAGSYPTLPPLRDGLARVTFLAGHNAPWHDGDYILGLDVGSTTTKAVLMRTDLRAIVSDVYLRTEGDPVQASRSCYRALHDRLPGGLTPSIAALGVTGSGRQIAGLHALTDSIFNEILAHARAAAHFDPEVDTIFEIGGQDAKYTLLANGVPVDYAMNQACSAGTGSFLEEAAGESLGLDVEQIAPVALGGQHPPDFNDQCSAFIGSDIKTAIHEGMDREDIAAGLVYSVCRNYISRVQCGRPTGEKVFMQGGVCYNAAVPMAMASLCRRDIVVPPQPGLMGAFGAALLALERLEQGAGRESWDLLELSAREAVALEPFVCQGGQGRCDLKCSIARYRIGGKIYPFGGSCDRYYSRRRGAEKAAREGRDLVRKREELFQGEGSAHRPGEGARRVGIPMSLMSNTFYPLYEGFFQGLGLEVVRGAFPDPKGMDQAATALCHPLIQAHGFVRDLLDRKVDRIFIPHVRDVAVGSGSGGQAGGCTCPLVQSEPYLLRAAFHGELSSKLVSEVLDLDSRDQAREGFARTGKKLGFGVRTSTAAFEKAWERFQAVWERHLKEGKEFLAGLRAGEQALVLFGRPYNAFTHRQNMGIPGKFASRGYRIIPHDMLLSEGALPRGRIDTDFWASGRSILRAAEVVRKNRALFGVFVTSFSCGPDSFILENFRSAMEGKPYLVLELDAHTADAGLDTRIEAFLEVIRSCKGNGKRAAEKAPEPPRITMEGGSLVVRAEQGGPLPVADPRVRVVIPSMGDVSSRGMASAMRRCGIHATALPPPGREELELGKRNASCKECLPYLLTSGALKRAIRERSGTGEILLCLMPGSDGPCRFGQYAPALAAQVRRERAENVGLLTLTCTDGYEGLPRDLTRRAILSIAITDGLTDLKAGVLATALERERSLGILSSVEEDVLSALACQEEKKVLSVLRGGMDRLAALRRRATLKEVTKVLLTGEIFVRKDPFSCCNLVSRLADQDVLVLTSPVLEWIIYVNHTVQHRLMDSRPFDGNRLLLWLKNRYCSRMARRVQEILRGSGFYAGHFPDIPEMLRKGRRLVDLKLSGEAILTISATLMEIGDRVHGVISVSPFGCMPGRIAQAIIEKRLEEDKHLFSKRRGRFWKENRNRLPLPFLALETDGNPLNQMAETRLDSFVMSAHRLNRETGTSP